MRVGLAPSSGEGRILTTATTLPVARPRRRRAPGLPPRRLPPRRRREARPVGPARRRSQARPGALALDDRGVRPARCHAVAHRLHLERRRRLAELVGRGGPRELVGPASTTQSTSRCSVVPVGWWSSCTAPGSSAITTRSVDWTMLSCRSAHVEAFEIERDAEILPHHHRRRGDLDRAAPVGEQLGDARRLVEPELVDDENAARRRRRALEHLDAHRRTSARPAAGRAPTTGARAASRWRR